MAGRPSWETVPLYSSPFGPASPNRPGRNPGQCTVPESIGDRLPGATNHEARQRLIPAFVPHDLIECAPSEGINHDREHSSVPAHGHHPAIGASLRIFSTRVYVTLGPAPDANLLSMDMPLRDGLTVDRPMAATGNAAAIPRSRRRIEIESSECHRH